MRNWNDIPLIFFCGEELDKVKQPLNGHKIWRNEILKGFIIISITIRLLSRAYAHIIANKT